MSGGVYTVENVESGDIVKPRPTNMVVTHTTRDGKGRYILRMECEIHYEPGTWIQIVRKVGT